MTAAEIAVPSQAREVPVSVSAGLAEGRPTAPTAPTARRRGSSRPPEPHRYTVRIPLADTSVSQWWGTQDDPSASVRALIRDEIMGNGFTDTVNRAVMQLPRRGRPPGFASEDAVGDEGWGKPAAQSVLVVQQQKSQLPEQPVLSEPVDPEPESERTAVLLGTAAAAAQESVSSASGDPIDRTADVPSVQFDMDDIFGHGG